MDFFALLRDDVRAGLLAAPPAYRHKHSQWLIAQLRPEGGFANRRGTADLYYTAFALRSLSALEALTAELAGGAAGYLKTLLGEPPALRSRQPSGAFCDAVASASWWDSLALCEEVVGGQLTDQQSVEARAATQQRLDGLRRADGGWAKTDLDAAGSLYHTLLAVSLYTRMGVAVPQHERVLEFIRPLKLPGGGFFENRYSKRPGTNGCAAGVSLSLLLGDESGVEQHAGLIKSMASAEGGFFATAGAPLADLLSTYTGLFTLKMLGQLDAPLVARAAAYARTLEQPGGGYTGFALESIIDCEYTFYGLGVESIAAG